MEERRRSRVNAPKFGKASRATNDKSAPPGIQVKSTALRPQRLIGSPEPAPRAPALQPSAAWGFRTKPRGVLGATCAAVFISKAHAEMDGAAHNTNPGPGRYIPH